MKFLASFLVVLCGMTSFNAPIRADDAKAGAPPRWYKLNAEEVYHSDFVLKPGESKLLKIDSAEPMIVGFRTDLDYAKVQAWKHPDLQPVYFSTATGEGLGATVGAASRFKPNVGTIALTAKNHAEYPVKVVVYTKPSPPPK